MIRAYAEATRNAGATGGNQNQNQGGGLLQRAGRAIRNTVNRLRGR